MDDTREQALFESYPQFFAHASPSEDSTESDEQSSEENTPAPPIAFGIECDDGWFHLIDTVAHTIETRINDSRTLETVTAEQIKEKFGELRIYVSHQPPLVVGVTQLARRLSQTMCERCGATHSVRRHRRGGWVKTLCERCGFEWRDVPATVPVRQFAYECHVCGDETPVLYPSGVGGPHGGSWRAVGEQMGGLGDGNIGQVFSDVQRELVYGNQCCSCGAYQGNYHVFKEAQKRGVADPEADTGGTDVETVGTVDTR